MLTWHSSGKSSLSGKVHDVYPSIVSTDNRSSTVAVAVMYSRLQLNSIF